MRVFVGSAFLIPFTDALQMQSPQHAVAHGAYQHAPEQQNVATRKSLQRGPGERRCEGASCEQSPFAESPPFADHGFFPDSESPAPASAGVQQGNGVVTGPAGRVILEGNVVSKDEGVVGTDHVDVGTDGAGTDEDVRPRNFIPLSF